MDELSKDLTLEMLPEGLYKEIAEAIGIWPTLQARGGGRRGHCLHPEA